MNDPLDTAESVQADATTTHRVDYYFSRKAAVSGLELAREHAEAAARHLDRLGEESVHPDICAAFVEAHHEAIAAVARIDLALEKLGGAS